MEQKLAAYLQSQEVPLDQESLKKADLEAHRHWYQKLEDFLYANPIEAGNAYYAVASAGYGVSGYLRRQDGNREAGNANLGVTGLSVIGALSSILIPERTPEQIKKRGEEGTLWGKVQEHPLGYVRWAFLGVDALAAYEAIGEYHAAKQLPKGDRYRPWQFTMAGLSVVAMVTSMVSDWLTSGSKKAGGSAEERSAAQQALEEAAAHQLMTLPPAERTALAKATAHYLVAQPELRFIDRDPDQLAQEMLQKIETRIAAKPEIGEHTKRIAASPFSDIAR